MSSVLIARKLSNCEFFCITTWQLQTSLCP